MSDKPKGYLVEWYDESAYSYFADEDGAMVKKFYLGQYTDDIKITPLYTRAQPPAKAKPVDALSVARDLLIEAANVAKSKLDMNAGYKAEWEDSVAYRLECQLKQLDSWIDGLELEQSPTEAKLEAIRALLKEDSLYVLDKIAAILEAE